MQGLGKRICPLLIAAVLATGSVQAQGKLQVVTTLTDLADIAKEIGGDYVETFAIATGYQNPHFVDPKPSYILKLTRADVFITIGLDLEIGWVPALLNSARNADIQPGGSNSAYEPLLYIYPLSISDSSVPHPAITLLLLMPYAVDFLQPGGLNSVYEPLL